MKNIAAIFTIGAALAVTACAETGAADDEVRYARASNAEMLANAEPVGEARSCIPITQIRSSQGVSERAMVFELSGGDYYRSEFGVDCPGARRDEAFRYRTSLTQLCNNEILTFFDPQTAMDYGSCALGEFVPIGDRELFRDAD